MKLINFFLSATLVLLLQSIHVIAQPGCPDINAGPNKTLSCGESCTNLTATYFNTGNTDSYTVSSIPYTPFSYTAGTSILVNQDDIWSPVINLPFTFCFFNNSYNQVVVGANGLISFDVSLAGSYCIWETINSGTFPTTNMYTNTIMGVYHDIDPSFGGTIKYQIIGTAPCRMFIISWNDVPMYDDIFLIGSCWGTPKATHQIVIYETTNAIEVYVKNRSACVGWNDGLGTIGIQNATGTKAYIASNYNNSVWSASNEAWRFTPSGTSIVSVDWLQGGNVIGTGTTVNVCPTAATTYTARATYDPCDGGSPIVKTSDVTITPNSNFIAFIDSSKDITCQGANNGAAYATVIGGVPPVTYGWNTAPNQKTITNLAPGSYIFTASDGSGCTIKDTVDLVDPPAMTVSVPNETQTNCSGTGTGSLKAIVSGGNAPYSFTWANSAQTDSVLSNVPPGTYAVTVTDANGCTGTGSGTLSIQTGGNNVSIGNPSITNVSCHGGNNGKIAVAAMGGSGIYTFSWSNTQSGDTAKNLIAGSYSVTVNDGAGCTATATYNVTEPTAVSISNPIVKDISCNGGNDGSISISTSGGTGTITANWSNAGSGTSITTLGAGTYSVTITDQNACKDSASYIINEPAPIVITGFDVTNIGCNNGVGSINVNHSGGNPAYTYHWASAANGQSYNTKTIDVTVDGVYNLTITDANNCTQVGDTAISTIPGVVASITSQTDVSCFNSTDGSATVSVSGGSGTISYTWSNAEVTNPAVNLPAGLQTVTVTDADNCFATTTVTIGAPDSIYVDSYVVNDVSCFGGNDGSISIIAAGGAGGFTYLWSNTETSSTIDNLTQGQYTLRITDARSCTFDFQLSVDEPTAITLTVNTEKARCFGEASGTATATAQGGTPTYSFAWSGGNTGGASPSIAQDFLAGSYSVTVTDAKGCTANKSFVVTENDSLRLSVTSTPVLCIGAADGTITLAASGGLATYNFSIDGNGVQQNNTSGTFENLSDGDYLVSVKDANNCLTSISATVAPANSDEFVVETDSTTCFGDIYMDGSIIITSVFVGNDFYTYSLNGVDYRDYGRFDSLAHGDYIVMVKSKNDCESTLLATVYEPAKLEAQITPNLLQLELGESAIVNTTHNGKFDVQYAWFPADGLSCTDCPNPIVAIYNDMEYTLMIKESPDGRKYCSAEATLTVEIGPHGEVLVPNMFSPNGDGINDIFYVYGNGVREIALRIFNRWGEKVFDASSIYEGWDGTYKTVPQPPDVYTYVVEFTFLDNQKLQKQGTISLVR